MGTLRNKDWNIGGLAGIMMGAVFIAVLGILLAWLSITIPYIPSHTSQVFCRYVLSSILFCSIVIPGSIMRRTRRDLSPEIYRPSMLVKLTIAGAFLGFSAIFMTVIPALPAKFFAKENVSLQVSVDRLSGFRSDHGYFTWIHYRDAGGTGFFMWTRGDPLTASLKHGDCIQLRGRKWVGGIYVDSISRSSACRIPLDMQ